MRGGHERERERERERETEEGGSSSFWGAPQAMHVHKASRRNQRATCAALQAVDVKTGLRVMALTYDAHRLLSLGARAERLQLMNAIRQGGLQPGGERLLAVFTVSARAASARPTAPLCSRLLQAACIRSALTL